MSVLQTNFNEWQKHVAVTSCREMADIMLPALNKHGITVFNYYKIYFDGSVVRLSTDQAWTEHYFKRNYLNNLTVPKSYLTKALNYYIWLTDDCPEMLLDAAINFDTSNGISIAKIHPDSIEYFCFASTRENTRIVNNFYLNNLDLLERYCDYFSEHGSHVLKRHLNDRIQLVNKDVCMADLNWKSLNHPNSLSLPKSQYACARLLLQGLKYREIAKELKLSTRTIESYVEILKDKMHCRSKSELIIKLINEVEN